MFRRKDEENYDPAAEGKEGVTPTAANTGAPAQGGYTPPQHTQAAPARPTSEPSKPAAPTAASFRPSAPSAARTPEPRTSMTPPPANTPAQSSSTSASPKSGSRRILTVGNDILLKGEISTCDRLVIEGKVDATLKDVHTVELAETGSFKGIAQVEDAEISGLFEGELVVKNRLVIYASGKVRGKITYGEIEIERGGEISGEIKTVAGANAAGKAQPQQSKAA